LSYELPAEIVLTLDEVRPVLLALYDARDALRTAPADTQPLASLAALDEAIRILYGKLVPDFPD